MLKPEKFDVETIEPSGITGQHRKVRNRRKQDKKCDFDVHPILSKLFDNWA